MAHTIVVVGYGPGISTAVAEKFGAAGHPVALVGRSEDRLVAGAKELAAKGIKAAAIRGDASDPVSIRNAVKQAHDKLGPVGVLHWNAYGGDAGNLATANVEQLKSIFDVAIIGLVSAVQEATPDLRSTKGSVLVTNGAFGDITPQIDQVAVSLGYAGLALANTAKHRLVGLLSETLKADGIYVGEVVVAGQIKGTAWDKGQATLSGSQIADRFWELHTERKEQSVRVAG
jgi:short-subunit dehydrogenase